MPGPTLRIRDLDSPALADDAQVEIRGWISPFANAPDDRYFALIDSAPCCIGCLPRAPERRVEVFAETPIAPSGRRVRLKGLLRRLLDDAAGWRYQLRDARLVDVDDEEGGNFTRRRVLHLGTLAGAAAAAGLAGCAAAPSASPPPPASSVTPAQGRAAIEGQPTVDVHSHAGGVSGFNRVSSDGPFVPMAAPMREGGMAVLCLAIVSDSPVHRVMADRRIHPFREPAPGELYAYGQRSFQRMHALAQAQGLAIVANAADLAAARSERPSFVVSAEGADFLEGQIDRVDEARERWTLRHLQLTHYRVNELGDIQTEPPVHGGLTPFGAEVIRRCNSQGIVVDVAHGTFALVKQAAAVTTRPLVLSHTSLSQRPSARSRLISPDHARVIAETGGVIGIWPPAAIFPDLPALAAGMARMADVVGVDHVALGSDMRGLVGPSTFDSYRDLPLLSKALLERGFGVAEVRQLLGGNYLRVFGASVPS